MQVSIVREDKMWGTLCRALRRPELEHDARFAETPVRRANAAALTAILDDVFKQQDWAYWHHLLTEVNIPHGPIARAEDIPADAQAVAARAVVETANPEMPRTLAAPFQVGGVTPRKAGPGPGLGEHTDEILRQAGFAAEEIAELRESGAAG
jgi:formyl-CoA transferase